MGAPEMKDVENRLFASELKCAIYSVDHRLAPESSHPAPVEDIYSVFPWLHANAGQLGMDPTRIGIKGESGGGGFAAATALYARDRQGPTFAFQHLIYPMIDDRTAVRKDLHPYVGGGCRKDRGLHSWFFARLSRPSSADCTVASRAASGAMHDATRKQRPRRKIDLRLGDRDGHGLTVPAPLALPSSTPPDAGRGV
jgi:acetyl esterase/lipase